VGDIGTVLRRHRENSGFDRRRLAATLGISEAERTAYEEGGKELAPGLARLIERLLDLPPGTLNDD
jgi:transcriptional regulator with XRE-family HTH domain